MSPIETLPALALSAVVSDREYVLNALGRPAVLIFHGQDTAAAAIAVNNSVRAVFPSPQAVLVASIIDLRQFPSMFHGMVKPELEKAYHKSAGKLPADADPADLIVLLPDWKGAVHDACEVRDSTRTAVVLVAAADGRIVARLAEDEPGPAVVTALQGL